MSGPGDAGNPAMPEIEQMCGRKFRPFLVIVHHHIEVFLRIAVRIQRADQHNRHFPAPDLIGIRQRIVPAQHDAGAVAVGRNLHRPRLFRTALMKAEQISRGPELPFQFAENIRPVP